MPGTTPHGASVFVLMIELCAVTPGMVLDVSCTVLAVACTVLALGLDDARNTAQLAWRMMKEGCVMKITRSLAQVRGRLILYRSDQ